MNKYKLFYLADEEWSKLEIESVYIVDGKENVSDVKASVEKDPTDVNSIDNGSQPVSVVYTNLLGQEIAHPQMGRVYLETVTYKDGRKLTRKVVAQ